METDRQTERWGWREWWETDLQTERWSWREWWEGNCIEHSSHTKSLVLGARGSTASSSCTSSFKNKLTIIIFFFFTAHRGLGFRTLLIQFYSVICHPSAHPVGRPQAEIRTRYGRTIEAGTLTTRPPHILTTSLTSKLITYSTSK